MPVWSFLRLQDCGHKQATTTCMFVHAQCTRMLRCCSQHLVSSATDTKYRGSISSGGMLQSKLWVEKKRRKKFQHWWWTQQAKFFTSLSCHNKEVNLPANHLTDGLLIKNCCIPWLHTHASNVSLLNFFLSEMNLFRMFRSFSHPPSADRRS